ncbi:MAG: hypothetical protein IIW17_09365, partial [Clostridia bacterium]|nr:hypothetical protein [Clostridia bacterium]
MIESVVEAHKWDSNSDGFYCEFCDAVKPCDHPNVKTFTTVHYESWYYDEEAGEDLPADCID